MKFLSSIAKWFKFDRQKPESIWFRLGASAVALAILFWSFTSAWAGLKSQRSKSRHHDLYSFRSASGG